MKIRELPEQEERVETGPTQFGDDWPGVFIRGDNAFFMAGHLQPILALLEETGTDRAQNDGLSLMYAKHELEGLLQLLQSCIVTATPIVCSKCRRADFDSDNELMIHEQTCR